MLDAPAMTAQARAAYAEIDKLGDPVVVHERTPTGFADHGGLFAFVRTYRSEQVIPGGPIEQGDFLATFNAATWPAAMRRLGQGDRVTWRGQQFAVMNQDDATRSFGGEVFGIDLQLRGGA